MIPFRSAFISALVACVWLGCGCQSQKAADATRLAPTLEELPTILETERVLSAKIGVEGAPIAPRRVLVPPLEPPQLTQTEKVALGLDKPDPFADLLASYPPRPDPARGVSPQDSGFSTAIYGRAGGLIGTEADSRRAGTDLVDAVPVGTLPFPRFGAMSFPFFERVRLVGERSVVEIAEDSARRGAGRHERVDD
ncbi:MAG: hypothetical protein HRF50_12610 [Phycisphaerae bacterium]|jgi:hypothetical protein